jgi:hypothetical protein
MSRCTSTQSLSGTILSSKRPLSSPRIRLDLQCVAHILLKTSECQLPVVQLIYKFVESVEVDISASVVWKGREGRRLFGNTTEHTISPQDGGTPQNGMRICSSPQGVFCSWRIPSGERKPHQNTTSCPRGQDFGQHIFINTGNRTHFYACQRVSVYGTGKLFLSLPPVAWQRGHVSLLRKLT